MKFSFFLLLEILLVLGRLNSLLGNIVPVLVPDAAKTATANKTQDNLQFLPFIMLIEKNKDTSEFWRETEILSLVRNNLDNIDYEQCKAGEKRNTLVRFPSRRTVRPICRGPSDPPIHPRKAPCYCNELPLRTSSDRIRKYHKHWCSCSKRRRFVQTTKKRKNKIRSTTATTTIDVDSDWNYRHLCPQCPQFSNFTECELFRDSCKEKRVLPAERQTYCDRKYGKFRAMFIPADYTQCRCCDECVFYRELDQSCISDEYSFDAEEFLPVTSIDFRAGCNPYWGHPEQEFRALRCDHILRRCVPVSVPNVPKETLHLRRNFRYEPPTGGSDCPVSCRGYHCKEDKLKESQCRPGAFLPDKDTCNCCGRCSSYQQLNEKCAEFKKTVHDVNGTKEIEVEEEFVDPGCDDGLVCRQGRCQDIHAVKTTVGSRRKRDESDLDANEPCKRELKFFKKKYGPDGHLHYDAPQCTPLWLYAPVQCRRFVCYCALEDGSIIQGIKVPRVEVTNMNCDCAREKCRTGSDMECDGYGNYKEAVFKAHSETWNEKAYDDIGSEGQVPSRTSSVEPLPDEHIQEQFIQASTMSSPHL